MDRARRSRLLKTAALCGTLAAGLDRMAKLAQTYTVAKGDTLSGIAARNGARWQDVARLNGISDPRTLAAGKQIRLPARQPPMRTPSPTRPVAAKPAARQAAASPAPQAMYRVAVGDTLSGIAARHGVRWQDVARLNGIANPDAIAAGRLLRLPPRPRRQAPQTATGRLDTVAGRLHAKLNNPNLEAAVLANFNRETGGSFDYRQKERGGGGGYGLPQYTGASLDAYRAWLARTGAQDSADSQVDYFVDRYMPTRPGYRSYTAPNANYTKEQYADWVHRKVLTPAHSIPGNRAFSQSEIDAVTNAHNAFMQNRLKRVNGVWRGVSK